MLISSITLSREIPKFGGGVGIECQFFGYRQREGEGGWGEVGIFYFFADVINERFLMM